MVFLYPFMSPLFYVALALLTINVIFLLFRYFIYPYTRNGQKKANNKYYSFSICKFFGMRIRDNINSVNNLKDINYCNQPSKEGDSNTVNLANQGEHNDKSNTIKDKHQPKENLT
jgi:hypothetical protein